MKALILIFSFISSSAVAQSAQDILKKTDEIRSPSSTYLMEVSVDSTDSPKFRYEIYVGGKAASLIKTLKPRREVGKNYLMQGEEMWAFIPNIRRSVRVSLNQKLIGQASNGDISRMRWFGDYDPKIEAQSETEWTLILTAKKSGLTYDKIRIWINKENYRPVKGEYLTKLGRALKFIKFEEFKELAGGLRPTKMLITNADDPSDFSILTVLSMQTRSFRQVTFTRSNLR